MPTLNIVTTILALPPLPADLQATWYNATYAAGAPGGKTVTNWNNIVGSSPLWLSSVATPSNKNWTPIIASDALSKRDRSKALMSAIQLKKLTDSYAKAQVKHDLVFSSGDYQTKVNNGAGNFSAHIQPTLSMTGARMSLLHQRGPASIHVRAICEDQSYTRDTGSGSTTVVTGDLDPTLALTPGPHYVKPGHRAMLKAGLAQKIIQIGALIMNRVLVAGTDLDNYNAYMREFLAGNLEASYSSDSTMAFAIAGGGLTLTTIITD